MFFGDDGFLYISNGDEGGLRDQYDSAQRLNRGLFSGVLRIDVDQNPARSHPIRRQPRSGGTGSPPSYSANYFIPNDNPFLDPAGTILEEFWALGLRSPHRMTLDRPTQTIWLGDVGQDNFEEVSVITRRGNYQWPYREGFQTGPRNRPVVLTGVDQPPIYDYPHESANNCVIGGYVYRGTRFPELTGKYLFGDNGSGRIWMMDHSVTPPVVTQLCTIPGSSWTGLSSFGLDHDNEIYLCKMGSAGRVYRLTRQTITQSPMPAQLSDTGAFTNLNNLAPARGLISYDVNAPLWSDGAGKKRWISLPNNGSPYTLDETIAFSNTGEWEFPIGTVFVKHFELSTNEANPSLKRRLETRFLVMDTNGAVYGATYKWRADNSDADLLTDSLSEDVTIFTATGTRVQTWYYPSPHDCRVCHNANANFVLGVKTRQLNGNFTYPGTGQTDNQLRAWNHAGMFRSPLNEADIGTFASLTSLTNSAASLESRIRSYLDANCSQCHRPGGVVQGYFDARFDTPLASQGLLDGRLANTLGIVGARVVAPQDLARSMLHTRMNSSNPEIKMPPLARNVADGEAVQALSQWIQLLPPTTNTLPAPWQHQDIGDVKPPGNALFSEGEFTISASGWDIWNVTDACHYVYQTISGNSEIIARVTGVPDTNPWAKAGLMFRQNLGEDSPHALLFLTPEHGVGLQSRERTGDDCIYIEGPFLTAPVWLKLVRTGTNFDGYSSMDGAAWTPVGSVTVPLTGTFHFGLAVTSHTNNIISSGTFDNVSIWPPAGTYPSLTLLRRDADGTVHLQVQGQANSPYSLEVSTSLTDWTAVATQMAASSTFIFTNRSATNTHQFYRVRGGG